MAKKSSPLARTPPTTRPAPAADALAVALEMEGLESLYSAKLELSLRRAQAEAARVRDLAMLQQRAEYMLKSVEVARTLPGDRTGSHRKGGGRALVKGNPLAELEARARKEMARAKKELTQQTLREDREFDELERRIRQGLLKSVESTLRAKPPRLAIAIHPVGASRAILQAERPSDLDAVLLCWLFRRRLPTRWGFFSDDAVDDLAKGPARFYAEEGVTDPWMASADEEDLILHRKAGGNGEGQGELLPVRMMLPIALPRRPFPRFRLIHHGPVAEVECRRKGQPYERLVDRGDAELLTGFLLRLQLDRVLDLTLAVE